MLLYIAQLHYLHIQAKRKKERKKKNPNRTTPLHNRGRGMQHPSPLSGDRCSHSYHMADQRRKQKPHKKKAIRAIVDSGKLAPLLASGRTGHDYRQRLERDQRPEREAASASYVRGDRSIHPSIHPSFAVCPAFRSHIYRLSWLAGC